jgi:signal transduction histidine kinase/DNA-binding response OmpR family regulator
VDYAGLSAGRYQFQVQARLPGEPPSRIATMPFRVTPPWYRLPWALGLWVVLGAGLLAGLGAAGVRWRTRRLQRRQWKLERTVAERTGALRSAKQKTEEQAERLREIDRLKSRFFTNVSHEFRTPLTLTIGPLEDLQAALRDAPTDRTASSLRSLAREKVDLALRNSRRLLRLIGQLLDIAKLEAGELRLTPQHVDLATFVQDRVRAFAPLAERRQVRFAVEAPEAAVPASLDPEKLGQVLTNLLSNAFKFTPPGGTIHVAVEHEANAGDARITVRDSGPGIPADEQAHLFERFYQSEETHADGTPGTGIGLSLAKDLTELHGGTLTVDSTVGIGTAFTVRLPVDESPEAASSDSDTAPTGPASTTTLLVPGRNGTPDDRPDGTQTASPPATPDPDDNRTTLLIADDNAEIRAYVRSHFENSYRILEAADGRAALNLARRVLPDLIISDVMMPDLDGIALVEALRSTPETDFLPVILLTARATEDDKIEGLSEGADAYLTKPFNVRELQTRVEALIASRQRLKQHVAEASPPAVEPPTVNSDPDALSESEEQYLEHVREAVRAHLSDPDFGVEALAEAMGQSRSTLYRRLRDSIGETPTAVLRTLRLRYAAALLEEKRGTVSEVAYAVGFKSVSHFSKSFRDVYDVSPSSYLDAKSAS